MLRAQHLSVRGALGILREIDSEKALEEPSF